MNPRTPLSAGLDRCAANILTLPRTATLLLTVMFLVASARAGPLGVVETKLRPEPLSEAAEDDHFGAAVAIDGDWMAIGVPDALDDAGWRQGAVDVYQRLPDGTWQREAVLTASDAQERDSLGQVLALDGDTLVVAARRRSDSSEDVLLLLYVFVCTDSGWIQEAALDPLLVGWHRISLCVQGDRFVVGLPFENGPAGAGQGAVYVYRRGANGWQLETSLTAEDPQESAAFGTAVAFDAEQLIVSAPWATSEPDDRQGVAYVFEFIDGTWMQTARIARPTGVDTWGTFGGVVAMRDGVAAVGHWYDEYSGFTDSGGAHVFERDGGDWEYVTMLRPEPSSIWRFTDNLALQGSRLFVSAWRGSPDPMKAVFIFEREAAGWTLQTQLDSPTGGGDGFGAALDCDGSNLCVGAPGHDGLAGTQQGAAYLYSEADMIWALEATLRRADGLLSSGDHFGASVAVQDDLLIAGSPADCDAAGCAQGSVYVYRRANNEWQLSQKLLAPDAQAWDLLGSSSAVSGNRFIVGAPGADTPVASDAGAAYVYRREGDDFILEARLHAAEGAPGDRFGNAVAMDGDRVIVGAHKANQADYSWAGAAYVFARVDGEWVQQARLVASDPVPRAYFGYSVALDGARAVVGAYWAVNQYRGAAYVFNESGGSWVEEARLTVNDAGLAISFGLAVAIEGDTIAVGAPRVNNPGADAGRVFVFSRIAGDWERQASLRPDAPMAPARFGGTLALRDGRMAIGAGSESDGDMWNHGAVYLFHSADGEWSQALRIVASDTHRLQYFGSAAVALDGSHVVVGVPCDGNGTGRMPGAVYDFLVLCLGDVNGDWTIDGVDLMTLLCSYGTLSGASRESGDLDGDRAVDLNDLAILLAHYGETCP